MALISFTYMEGDSVPELKCMYTYQSDWQRWVSKNADSKVTRVYMTRKKAIPLFFFKLFLKTFTVVWREQLCSLTETSFLALGHTSASLGPKRNAGIVPPPPGSVRTGSRSRLYSARNDRRRRCRGYSQNTNKDGGVDGKGGLSPKEYRILKTLLEKGESFICCYNQQMPSIKKEKKRKQKHKTL